MPDRMAHYAIQDHPLSDAPFAVGDKIIFRGQPEHGLMTVTEIRPHERGEGWAIFYTADGGVCGCCPEWRVELAPEGFTDPPAMPTTIALTKQGTYEPAPNPAAYPFWRAQMERWLAKWNRR